MSASLAVHAILILLALGACLVVAFVCLRQVFRLFAAHAPSASSPQLLRTPVALRPVEDDEDDGDALSPLPASQPASHVN